MTKIYHIIKVKVQGQPERETSFFYSDTYFDQNEALADAVSRLEPGQQAEYQGYEFV
jgi:hypothetical protein